MDSAKVNRSDDDESPNIVILNHPSGSKIYLVATAHISRFAQKDVEDAVRKADPAAIVLELDEERLAKLIEGEQTNDPYGIRRFASTGPWKIAGLALTGELLPFVSGLMYGISGAILGVRPGGEFLAGIKASESTGMGADIICGDRDQVTTMRRLQWYSSQLARHRRVVDAPWLESSDETLPHERHGGRHGRWHERSRTPQVKDEEEGRVKDFRNLDKGDPGSFESVFRGGSPGSEDEDLVLRRVRDEMEATPAAKENPWGLQDDDDTESAIKARLIRMMEEGGCVQPNKVLEAAQRLLKDGLDKSSPRIRIEDLATVRQCAVSLVENFRTRAAKGDSTWAQEIEVETVAGAKGAIGARRSGLAMRKVIVDERDLILARNLWEAGQKYGPQSVVGIVGAGHIKGIQRYWPTAGTPEVAAKAVEFNSLPRGEGSPSFAGMAFTGALLGWLAYRQPKAVAFLAGAAALLTAPTIGFSVVGMRRLVGLAQKVEVASNELESGFGSGEESFTLGEWS